MALTHEERLAKAVEFNKIMAASKAAGQIATRDLIKADTLTSDEISTLVNIYPAWKVGELLKIGDLVAYNDVLYETIQEHTTQADWTPDVVPALFKSKAPAAVIPEWIQPTGSTDAYNMGDQVTFEGKVYQSLIDANVWSPTAYPSGWQEVTQ